MNARTMISDSVVLMPLLEDWQTTLLTLILMALLYYLLHVAPSHSLPP